MASNGMDTLGSRLEEARKGKGVSLREASEATKIRMEYLSQFESDDFDIPLPPIYQRGFVKIYARYLGEDPAWFAGEIQARLNRSQSFSHRSEGRSSLGQMDLSARRRAAAAPPAERGGVAVEDAPEPGGEPSRWKIPQMRMPSFGSRTRESDPGYDEFEETGEPLDRTFYLKVAAIVGSVTVAVVLMIAVAKLVFAGGDGDERESAEPAPGNGSEQAEVVGGSDADTDVASEIIVRAVGGPTWVQVRSAGTDEVLERFRLDAGQSRTVAVDGEVLVQYTQGENLEVEKGGEIFAPTDSGAAWIRIE
ncbi:MAG: helix-turn-helix domain-containing protein [Puniceicoccaceae bacterium]